MATATNNGKVRVTSAGELEKKSIAELTEIYNSTNPPQRAEGFTSNAAAVKAVLTRLAETQEAPSGEGSITTRSGRRKTIDRAPAKDGAVSSPRRGSKREKLLLLLTSGPTFEEVMKAMNWSKKLVREHCHLLNDTCGYGVREHKSGAIQLTRWNDKKRTKLKVVKSVVVKNDEE